MDCTACVCIFYGFGWEGGFNIAILQKGGHVLHSLPRIGVMFFIPHQGGGMFSIVHSNWGCVLHSPQGDHVLQTLFPKPSDAGT